MRRLVVTHSNGMASLMAKNSLSGNEKFMDGNDTSR